MAGAAQYPVSTVPTLLAATPASSSPGPAGWFTLSNGTGATVYLNGGTTVSSTNGYALGTSATTGAVLSGWLFSGDSVYGVTASGTSTVSVLKTGP